MPKNYRISVTLLDAFNTYMLTGPDDRWELTHQMLVDQIMGKFVPSDKMRIGTLMHSFMEGEEIAVGQLVEYAPGKKFFITEDIYDTITGFRELYPTMAHEIKATKSVRVGDDIVTVVGKIDGLDGGEVHDHKFTGKIDVSKYSHSYQWRYYLWMWGEGIDTFVYNLFEIDNWDAPSRLNGEQLKFLRHDGMDTDCLSLLGTFVSFLKRNNLDKFLISKK